MLDYRKIERADLHGQHVCARPCRWVSIIALVLLRPQVFDKITTIIAFVLETVLLPSSSSGEMAQVRRSVSEALWATCAADSMSMPVHWYYDISDIKRDFGGWICGLNSPRDAHPSSILSLSNTGRITLRKIIA